MKRLVIGILAHVDSGKTTLSEAMLYHAGALRKLGRVDHRDAFLDTDALERARGITIFAKQAVLRLPDTEITLLDTPGHVDFSAEAERALQVMDYAILVISGTDGIQSHTETLWRLLERYRVPVFVFVEQDGSGRGRPRPAPGRAAPPLRGRLRRPDRPPAAPRTWPSATRNCWRTVTAGKTPTNRPAGGSHCPAGGISLLFRGSAAPGRGGRRSPTPWIPSPASRRHRRNSAPASSRSPGTTAVPA